MTKKQLVQFIREEAMKLAIEQLKPKKEAPVAAPVLKRELSEEELDEILFNGGPSLSEKNIIAINESVNKVKVTTGEIDQFENDFKSKVSPQVVFDKQENGYSLFLYKGEEGMEARASGSIKINSANDIVWRFSVQDGADVKASLKLTDDTYGLITKLYEFFQSWQKDWTEKLSGTNNISDETASQAPPAPTTAAPAAPGLPPAQ